MAGRRNAGLGAAGSGVALGGRDAAADDGGGRLVGASTARENLGWGVPDGAVPRDLPGGAAAMGRVSGGGGDDVVRGGGGRDVIEGGRGADRLVGRGGNDVLKGGAGRDALLGGGGDDRLVGDGGGDVLKGGGGKDTLLGGAGRDRLEGGRGDDVLKGGAGKDTLLGGGGDDRLVGGRGDDLLKGGRGKDTLLGGGGDDRLVGGGGGDVLKGGGGQDRLLGGAGRDRLEGGGGRDTLLGGGGRDRAAGGGGDDVLKGGGGRDVLLGGAGRDVLDGGRGDDVLTGGRGADIFVAERRGGTDTVRDFGANDRLDLTRTGLGFSDLDISQTGAGARIDYGSGTMVLRGVAGSALTAADFVFAPGANAPAPAPPPAPTPPAPPPPAPQPGAPKPETTSTGGDEKVETQIEGELSQSANQGGARIGMDAFRADPTFGRYDGTGYTVVVLDTGIDLDHAAFGPDADRDGVSDRILYHQDFTRSADGRADDVQGHGTNVASIVGSSEAGYLGIASDVNIVALQVLGDDGRGSLRGIESALQWVVDNAATYNVVAVNLSLGGGDNVNSERAHRVFGDEFRALDAAGVISVAAAGNDYYDHRAPGLSSIAADPNVVGVGALWAGDFGGRQWGGPKDFSTGADRLTSFTQRTAAEDVGLVFAPGALITGARPGGGFSSMGGTSQAAPMVAGMAALAQEIADDLLGRRLTPGEFEGLLRSSASGVTDGDDEDDNVPNLGAAVPKVDMLALARAIQALGGGTPPPAAPADDYAQDRTTTGRVAPGQDATGTLEAAGDRDWFALDLRMGDTYRIDVMGARGGHGTLADPMAALMGPDGAVLTQDDDGGAGRDASITYTAQTTGTHYVAAQGYAAGAGSYRVAVERTAQGRRDDYAADTGTTGAVSVGGSATGTLEVAGDRDWHRVAFEANGTYVIDLSGLGLADPFLRLHDGAGTLVASNDDFGGGRDAQLLFTAARAGTYFVGVAAAGDAGTGDYRVSVSGGTRRDDVADDPSTTATLAVGGTYDGTLSPTGDRDWVRVDLAVGAVYDLSLSGRGANGVADTYLRVFDAAGALVDWDDDGGPGRDSRIPTLSVDAAGTYFVSAGGYGDGYRGDYRISLDAVSGGAGELPADASTPSTVAVGGEVTSAIDFAGDRDWHEVALTAGQTYRVSLDGTSLADPYLRAYDASGRMIASDDDSVGLDSELFLTAARGGTYYLSAGAYGDAGAGGYVLGVETLGTPDDYAGDATSTGRLAPDGSVTGGLEVAGDHDWFAFEATAGGVYRFDLRGAYAEAGSLVDPILSVRDAAGTQLAFDDDGGAHYDSRITFSAERSGTVWLDASGYDDEGGTYTLSATVIATGADDHPDDVPSESRVAVGGAADGVIEVAGDFDVFAVDLSAGGEYRFSVAASGAEGLGAAMLGLFDARSMLVGYDDSIFDGATAIEGRIDAGGTYYLAVAGVSDAHTGGYVLRAAELGAPAASSTGDDHGDTVSTAGRLSGGAARGDLETAGDRDWIAIDMAAGDSFRFTLTGHGSGDGTLYDPYLTLYDAGGRVLARDDDGAGDLEATLTHRAATAGTVYAEAGDAAGTDTGTWLLSVA